MERFSFGRLIACLIVIITLPLGLTWMVQGNNFFLFKFFAPREEAVRREVFEQSKAYNEGMAQELRRMQMEYIKADDKQKEALASVILHQFAGYNANTLPPDLRLFINELKVSQGIQQ